MNDYSVNNDTFFIARTYKAAPERVFAAWADPALKANWFPKADVFDFRIGGLEIIQMAAPDGTVFKSTATFHEIVPSNRIIYTMTIDMGERRISVGLITIEFKPEGTGTQLVYTEQCVFLDGMDSADIHREGANDFLDKLGAELERAS
ncbi:SRPBCC family protein [Paenibacillus sp. R14(2021)]|uniref:SRPBCC family protein n=1 Tax=Paenibacillus sp. R14(2021) TaxID=2859228 RepID=UPI001C6169EE|nr:SRPBCC family protein [Paenibacillus sp. R14(2021)]